MEATKTGKKPETKRQDETPVQKGPVQSSLPFRREPLKRVGPIIMIPHENPYRRDLFLKFARL